MKPFLSVTEVAHICHDANRAICRVTGDDSQPLWEDAPEWQKESARKGVLAAIENPNITPEQLHEKWSEAKIADGWKFGPVKDADKKEHPCLVPYWELKTPQRYKDVLFRSIVNALTGAGELAV